MRAFQAYAKGATVTGGTARAAARKFFEKYPTRRKCNVTEGEIDGMFFVTRWGVGSGQRPQTWKDVTKKTMGILPEIILIEGTGAPIAGIEASANKPC